MGSEYIDGTEIANAVFSCVYKLRQRYGVNHIASILIGSESQKILSKNHNQMQSYGVLKQYSLEQVKVWIKELMELGYLEQAFIDQYPIVKLKDRSSAVHAGKEKVSLSQPDPNLATKWPEKGESTLKTLELWKQGVSIEKIAEERKTTTSST